MSQIHMKASDLKEQLLKIKEVKGEEAYEALRRDIGVNFIHKTNGDTFLKSVGLYSDEDLDKLRNEQPPPKVDPQEAMFGVLKEHLPNIKTQAQFDAFVLGFSALKDAMVATFEGNEPKLKSAKEALEKSLAAAQKATEVVSQLEEIPEDMRSAEANAAMSEPKEIKGASEEVRLTEELQTIASSRDLAAWYEANTESMNGVVGKARDRLFDKIRQKKIALAEN